MKYPQSIQKLIDHFTMLPGVGTKTAERMAFHVLKMDKEHIDSFSKSLKDINEKITYCNVCHHITEIDENPCGICTDQTRDLSTLCVVEQPKDVIAMEKMGAYKGKYHVLHGSLSPINGIGVDDINIKSLIQRLQDQQDIVEVIIATNPNMEGETTAMYISRLLNGTGIKVTRIAHGLPVGADIEYADEVTLAKALEGRRVL